LFATIALTGLVACVPPKIMLHDSFLPGTNKAARESIKLAGELGNDDNAVQLTNYYVQVCDVDGAEQTNCRTSLILSNITDYQVRVLY